MSDQSVAFEVCEEPNLAVHLQTFEIDQKGDEVGVDRVSLENQRQDKNSIRFNLQ